MKVRKPFVTHDELDAFMGGGIIDVLAHAASHESGGGDPLTFVDIDGFGDYLDQAVKQASSPLFANLNLGAAPFIRQLSGVLTIQTNEGVNTNTYVHIKGEGTGAGRLRIFDEDDAEHLYFRCNAGIGYIETAGTTPSRIYMQYTTPEEIRFWGDIPAGNPYFYIFGWHATDTDWMRMRVEADGDALIEAENKLNFRAGGSEFNFGATPLIRQSAGALTIQTDEGVNTVTFVEVKGKGTERGQIHVYDEDDNEYLRLTCLGGHGYINTAGTVPGRLFFQLAVAQDIRFWSSIVAGNPYFYIHGWHNTDVDYMRFRVDSDGYGVIDSENLCLFLQGGNQLGWYNANFLTLEDGKMTCFGTSRDYSIGYHEPTDSLQIVDGSTLNANIRIKIDATGNISFPAVGSLHLGATPLIRQASGAITFQTDEGVNTATYVDIKGKGTGGSYLRVYDQDDAEYLQFSSATGIGYIRVRGAAPAGLRIQYAEPQDISCWSAITEGNPYFYIYGFKAADAVKYGRMNVDAGGIFQIDAQLSMRQRIGGAAIALWQATGLKLYDNLTFKFGTSPDYSIGYHEPTDSLQIVDGATLNADIRAKLTSDAKWEFHDWVGIGKTPTVALDVDGTIKATQFYLNLGGLLDVTLGTLEEGETIRYDQATDRWIDGWGISYDNPRLVYKMYTDFFSAASDANDPWVGTSFGGIAGSIPGTNNHPGIVELFADGINEGYRFLTATNCILIAGAEHSEFCFQVSSILPNIRVRLGYQDSLTATLPTDGVYIDISDTTLAGKTRNNGAGSTTGSDYAISNNTWYRGKIAVIANQALTLLVGGYVNCVGGDVGKQVQVDGEEFGLLDSYDNPTRVWKVSTGKLIPDGSTITITDGTGEGIADGDSVLVVKEVEFILYSEAGQVLWTDSLATNIPTAAGRETGHGVVMYVAADVERTIDLDMMIATRAGYVTR